MIFPITITELALKRMLLAKEDDEALTPEHGIRVSVRGGGCAGWQNDLGFDDDIDEGDHATDFSVDGKSIKVIVDEVSAMYLDGTEIDYEIRDMQEGFKFNGTKIIIFSCTGVGRYRQALLKVV